MRRKAITMILLLVALGSFAFIHPCKADGEIIDYYNLMGTEGHIECAIYVYRDKDSMTTKDFYSLKIHLHAVNDDPFNYFDFVNHLRINSPQGICDLWEPTSGWQGEGIISLSYGAISFSIWIPTEGVEVTGGFTHEIQWVKAMFVATADDMFAGCFWVPENAGFEWSIDMEILSYQGLDYWYDWISFSAVSDPPKHTLTISSSSGGTTNPPSGTYVYDEGTSVTVTASAYSGYTFSYWILDGTTMYGNPIAVTMNSDHDLTAYFNAPPNTPSMPSGPTSGCRNVWYTYTTSTTDPDGDNVRYQFEFTGPDTNVSFTTGWYASGQTGSITVQWEPSDPLGTYQIRVRAQDVYGLWSDWSPSLTVIIEHGINLVVQVPQAPPEGVTVWVDGDAYTSPVDIMVTTGEHTIEVGSFLKEEGGTIFRYTFDHWSDGSTDNPRTIHLTSDTTLTAYYVRSKTGIQSEEPE